MTPYEPATAVRGFAEDIGSSPPSDPTVVEPVAIRAVGITKTFRLPHERRTTLKERALNPFASPDYEVLEALHDVSFEVRRGEFFGIIGRNGSGKSTLLRCLAGIYVPNSGEATVEGRLAPFIELGVGFNPELPARENVIQSAVLFGLEPREAADRFESIIAFAELERFADQRLKNYSSGMAARLAFAVTIHVDADVLLFDEVLAVGDAAFSKKCIDHFERLRERENTIVFVTHDMNAIEHYCDRVLLLDRGHVLEVGPPEAVVARYGALTSTKPGRTAPPAPSGTPPLPAGTALRTDLLHRVGRRVQVASRLLTRPLRTATRPVSATARRLVGPLFAHSSMLGSDPRRFFVLTRLLATTDFRLKYEGTLLTYVWALARPAALFGVLLLVFGRLGRFNQSIDHYPAYLLLGIVVWTFFAQAAATSVGCLRRRAPLLRKLPFPRLAVPLSMILTAAFDLTLNFVVVFSFVFALGVSPRLSWLELPFLLGIVAVFATGIGCLISVLYVRYRDLDQLWAIVSQVLFYLTPIFYVATMIPEPVRQPLLLLNPLAAVFTEVRHAVVDPSSPSAADLLGGPWMVAIPIAVALGTLALGLWVFARESPRAPEFV